ncbi:uncharacterized protein LOC103956780 [Pyrus x bretschneideri]|uniref:uncharacterized protein LOC103956780 n=1 Tax=Pyrus x bretschneideri TaxID=225117 RepID=UPI00202FDCE1|nr:uncharacterized protein LOC103956780 [Pyrus x bretschneideri]
MKLIEKLRLRLFNKAFNSTKCDKTTVLVVDRIRKLRKRKEEDIVKMRNKICALLQCGQDPINKTCIARILIEDLIREENILEAYVLIKGFCNLVRGRLLVIQVQRECLENLKQAISSLIFAAKKCFHEIPELLTLEKIFKKYGSDFVLAATQPNYVTPVIVEKLSNRNSTDEEIEKIIQQITKPCNINGEQVAWNCHPTSPYLYDGVAYNAFINYK